MTKVKIITRWSPISLENDINEFIEDKIIVDIKFANADKFGYAVMVIYED